MENIIIISRFAYIKEDVQCPGSNVQWARGGSDNEFNGKLTRSCFEDFCKTSQNDNACCESKCPDEDQCEIQLKSECTTNFNPFASGEEYLIEACTEETRCGFDTYYEYYEYGNGRNKYCKIATGEVPEFTSAAVSYTISFIYEYLNNSP